MTPVVGWEEERPVPNHEFNDYLSARDGRLFYEDLDLAQLMLGDATDQGLGQSLSSPLEIVYLPKIRGKIQTQYGAGVSKEHVLLIPGSGVQYYDLPIIPSHGKKVSIRGERAGPERVRTLG